MSRIADTAYYCCGVRMEDAEREFSLCNDRFARRFMDASALEIYQPFRSEKMPNISNATRCRIIDDLLRDEIRRHRSLQIVTIGAGFDSRPYRIEGGSWLELDGVDIVAIKNDKLPTGECPNRLERIPIDFESEALHDKLHGLRSQDPVLFVIEGVFMYLSPEAIRSTLDSLSRCCPTHLLLCDLMNSRFFGRFGSSIHDKLVAMDARFSERPERPEMLFVEHGYDMAASWSIFRRALELGALKRLAGIPNLVGRLMVSVLLKDLNGYAVYRFERSGV